VLNSAGRLGEPETAARIFLADQVQDIESLIDTILELNRKRKNLGEKIWGTCLNEGSKSLEKTSGKFVLVQGESIHRGITGILAARLVSYFKVPALVISIGNRKAVGSLRSPYSLDGFLDLFADLLWTYGGHDCAAGFSLSKEFLPEFATRFFLTAGDHRPPEVQEQKLMIDAEVPPPYLNPDLIRIVEFFEPYGEGNPPLHFLTRGLLIEQLEIIGRRDAAHLKLLLGSGRFKWPAVYWNAAEKAGRDFNLHDSVDVVYRLARNYFQNTESLQLTILDLKVP
jgi:single-stranded-DNA-specific exonuclease